MSYLISLLSLIYTCFNNVFVFHQRMDQAENELRALQSACRALIVRTAGGVVNGNIDKVAAKSDHIPAEE